MATVYLADDLKHERKVALKVLKPELAAVVGAERFLAEIKTTANLTHPHILPLHDSGEADGFLFFVMPFVEGDTLRDRIDREKQLPVDEAVALASKVAGALQHAHEHGVIHRDIKPGNILLQDGEPVVADFGIALAVGAAGSNRLTETGLSLGTPYYMSPEQATGDQLVGASTDTYALGAVLYEMLTGDPPYMGSTAQAVLGQIISAKPISATEKRPSIPANVDAAVRKALEKLPADRFSTAQEFMRALGDPGFRYGKAVAELAGADSGPWKPLTVAMTLAATVLGVIALLSAGWPLSRQPGAPTPVVRAYLELPPNAYLLPNPEVAMAADGSTVVVTARVDGRDMLIQRRLDALDFTPIAGEEFVVGPAISPDGQAIAFGTLTGLHRLSLTGGPTVALVPGVEAGAGDWAADGTIYYTPDLSSGVWGVSSDGGVPFQITAPDRVARERAHLWPQLLPDGEHLIFTAYHTPFDNTRIMAVSLGTGALTTIQERAVFARYSPTGHLLFARGPVLYAAPFDIEGLATTGAAEPVIDGIAVQVQLAAAAYALSDNGTLVYVAAEDLRPPRRIVWIDRTTKEETVLPLPPGLYEGPALSPEGTSLAVAVRQPGGPRDVIIVDLEQGRSVPLAQGPDDQFAPVWTPDGERVVFTCEVSKRDICARATNSSDTATLLLSSDFNKQPYSFSSDGTRLILAEDADEARFLRLSLTDPTAPPDTLLRFEARASALALSPDDRWIAYVSDETGVYDVWVESLDPSLPRRWRVSSGGGYEPLWTKEGQELVYRIADRGVFAVSIDVDSGEPGTPELLFADNYYATDDFWYRDWDVTPDGQRFFMIKEPEDRRPRRLVVITNFFEELKRLVPN